MNPNPNVPSEHSSYKAAKRQRNSILYGTKNKPKKQIGNWELTKTLGEGSCGKVKLAVNTITNEKRACKIIPVLHQTYQSKLPIGPTTSIRDIPATSSSATRNQSNSNTTTTIHQRIIREAAIMLLLDHPHIVTLHEIHLIDNYYYFFFQAVNGGQMLDFIISHGKLKEKQAKKFMRQIISAIDYCHCNSIVHRDLKIENILIDDHGGIKLIDFGLSNLYDTSSLLSTFCGSLYFSAPELLLSRPYIGPEVDIWSLGIILYVLVCGQVPFDDTSMPILHAKIKAAVLEYPTHVSSECKSLIAMCLQPNPSNRCSMEEIKCHSWISKGFEPLDNYLPKRPLLDTIDLEVVKRMKGFGFGSDEEITEQLTKILEKRKLNCENIQQSSLSTSPPTASGSPLKFSSPITTPKSFFEKPTREGLRKVGRAIKSASTSYMSSGKIKSTSSTEPLLSIYYLVMEKLEKKKKGAVPTAGSAESLVEDEIAMSPSSDDDYGDMRRRNSDFSPKKRVVARNLSSDNIPLDNIFAIPQLASPPRRTRASSLGDINVPAITNSTRFKNLLEKTKYKSARRRPNPHTEGESESDAEDLPVKESLHQKESSLTSNLVSAVKKKFQRSKSKFVSSINIDGSDVDGADPPIPSSFPQDKSYLSSIKARRKTISTSAKNISFKTKRPPVFVEKSEQENNGETTTKLPRTHNIKNATKRVFLKGLFSVSSSSTKSIEFIKADLRRVFAELGVDVLADGDMFECRFDKGGSSTSDLVVPNSTPGNAGVDVDDEDDPDARIGDSRVLAVGEIDFDMEPPTQVEQLIGEPKSSSTRKLMPTINASEQKIVPRKNSDPAKPKDKDLLTPLRQQLFGLNIIDTASISIGIVYFDVYIVKIPLLGLRGIQFRRISGNSWQYKRICDRILRLLKL